MRALDRRGFLLAMGAGVALAAAAGCGRTRGERPRCAFCGMRVAAGSHWEAGATGGDGAVLAFDTPGCLLRFRTSARGAGMRDEWVTEYYGAPGLHTPARSVRFVVGSDVVGPMGPDLVPVAPERAQTFRRDHHASADYAFDAVNDAVLRAL